MNKVQKDNLIRKITKGGDNFILGKGSMIIFMSMIIVAAIVNYSLFAAGVIPVKSPFMSPYLGVDANGVDIEGIYVGTKFAYLGGLSMTLSFTGSLLNIWGFILITRMDKKFIYPILLGGVLSIPNEIFVGAIFSGVCFSFLVLVEVGTGLQGRKEDEVSHSKASKKHYIALAIVGVVFVTVGLSISLSVDGFTNDSYFVPIMDVLGSSVVLVCGSLALLKNKGALLVLVLNDSVYISLYIVQGVYSMSVTFLVYMSMNFIGFLGGSSKEREEKEKQNITVKEKQNSIKIPEIVQEEDVLIFR